MDARGVTDSFEWSALARLAPSFTHEWSWARMCADQFRALTFRRVQVEPMYLRSWVDEHLIGCPLLVLGDEQRSRTIVVPRASPAVLNDQPNPPDPADVLDVAGIELDDSTDVTSQLAELRAKLARAKPKARSWSLTPGDVAAIAAVDSWASVADRDLWLRWLDRFWRGAWKAELVTYQLGARRTRRDAWVVQVHRGARPAEVVTVVIDGLIASPWMSPRLRS